MKKHFLHFSYFLLLAILPLYGGEPELRYGVESHNVTLQQGFLFQISVQHDKEVPAPVLPAMKDFTIQAQPPQKSSFSNISFVNGRKSSTRYIKTFFNYTLTPQKLGRLTISPVTVTIDGKHYRTRPISIQVSKPEEYPGMFLETRFSVKKCYVGEPVMISWTWGFDRDIRGYTMNLPVFLNQDFHFPEYTPPIDQQRYKYLRIPTVEQKELIGWQTQIRHNGNSQSCIKFQHPFIPARPGTYTIPPSSITCEITDENARRQSRRSDPFDDMDDFFGDFGGFFGGRRTPLKKITIVSRPVVLEVLPLPTENQPESFSGIIGECRLTASASPLEVNVGEPMILTLKLSGPEILDKIRLPELEKQKNIADGFKISTPEPGTVQNGVKIFQRTLRARNPEVKEIPPVEISYFNSRTGKYEIARSQPIPIKVTAAREVTVQDAQGIRLIPVGGDDGKTADSESRKLEATGQGIAHNYESSELLHRQSRDLLAWLHRPLIAMLLILPMLLWCSLLTSRLIRQNSRANQAERRMKKAGSQCLKQLKKIKISQPDAVQQLYDILQNYFSLRLQKSPGTISANDLRQAAAGNSQLEKQALPAMTELLENCEFSRFSGASSSLSAAQMKNAIQAVRVWEKYSR